MKYAWELEYLKYSIEFLYFWLVSRPKGVQQVL